MLHRLLKSLSLVLVITFFISCYLLLPNALAEDTASMVDKIQQFYDNYTDIKGSFIQRSYIKDLKRTDAYKGVFYKKSKSLRWDYIGDKPQSVYIKGDNITVYLKNEKQAFLSHYNEKSYGTTPLALLQGLINIGKDFYSKSLSPNSLQLVPKRQSDTITKIIIKLKDDTFPISDITIYDKYSNKIDIQLFDIELNTKLNDSLFEFKLPKDVKVIRQ